MTIRTPQIKLKPLVKIGQRYRNARNGTVFQIKCIATNGLFYVRYENGQGDWLYPESFQTRVSPYRLLTHWRPVWKITCSRGGPDIGTLMAAHQLNKTQPINIGSLLRFRKTQTS